MVLPPQSSLEIPDSVVVIVGTGPPAAAAALLLIRAGVDVLVLEAGPEAAARGLTVRVKGVTVARIHRPLGKRTADVSIGGDPRSVLYEEIGPGGLTNHWSCAVPRFSRDDFEDGRRAGEASTWPIDYHDLVPWYEWVEPLLKIAGTNRSMPALPAGKVAVGRTLHPSWQPIADEAARHGQALVPVPYVFGAQTTLTFSGTVCNSFVRQLAPARRSRHLAIRCNARVTELEWSGARRRVESVIFRDMRTGLSHRIRCRAVVLGAGAVNTAKILLQSSSPDFPEGLGNAHGVLGRYLHDHPLGKVEFELDSPIPFHPAACLTRQSLQTTSPLYAAACLQWSGVNMLTRSLLDGHPGRLSSCGFNVFGTMAPDRAHGIELDRSTTAVDGTPGLRLTIRHPEASALALQAARDQLGNLLEYAKFRPRVRLWTCEPVGGAVHYAGTCRMHTSPHFGMLDRWSRLREVANVTVADSAAFTTGPEKNPVLTAMALAARAGDRLIEDMRTRDA
jgi:choline dehydrogenase-like flavoprotein